MKPKNCDVCGVAATCEMHVRHFLGHSKKGGRRRRYTLRFCEKCEDSFWAVMRDFLECQGVVTSVEGL